MLKKLEEVLKKVLKFKPIYYIVTILVLVLLYYSNLKRQIIDVKHSDDYRLLYMVMSSIVTIIVGIIIYLVEKYKKMEIHKLYLLMAIPLGIIYLVIIPLFAQSDETSHYLRSYEIANGNLLTPIIDSSKSDYFPRIVMDTLYTMKGETAEYKTYDDVIKMMKLPAATNDKDSLELVRGSGYPPINYLPQVIGMKLGMILKLNPYFIGMLGRIANLIGCTLFFAFGLKLLPKNKMFAALVLLSPVVLSYTASLSADSTTIAVCFLFISYILHFIQTKQKLKLKDYILLFILAICVAICKVAYLPIVGIAILIPDKCFKNKKNKYIMVIPLIVVGILASLIWLKLGNINLTGTESANTWIYRNPISFLMVVIRTTFEKGYGFMKNVFAGEYLCHHQIEPYELIPFIYIVIVAISLFNEKVKKSNNFIPTIISVLIMIMVYGLICAALYTANTENYAPTIVGIQGRYFIPILLMLPIFCNNKKFDISFSTLANISMILNLAIMYTMIITFIV